MPTVSISDIEYGSTKYEERILHYMKIYKKLIREHKKFPLLGVSEIKNLDPKTKIKFAHLIKDKKYIINNGRHRLHALRRLGIKTVDVKILRKR